MGGRCPSTFLFCHLNSFCRLFRSSTVGTTGLLRVALADHGGGTSRPVPVYKIPCRTTTRCVQELIRVKRGITIYRRVRSTGLAGNVIEQRIIQIVAPNAFLGRGNDRGGTGGCLTDIFQGRTNKCTLKCISVKAKRLGIALLAGRSNMFGRLRALPFGRVILSTGATRILARGLRGRFKVLISVRRGLVPRASIRSLIKRLPRRSRGSILILLLDCLSSARGHDLSRLRGTITCRASTFLGVSACTQHGLRLSTSVQARRGGNDLL